MHQFGCVACPHAEKGPKTKLVVKLDLAKFKDVKDEFTGQLSKVREEFIREDYSEELVTRMEADPEDIGIVVYTGFLCECASAASIKLFINDLFAAANSAVGRIDCNPEEDPGCEITFDRLERVGNDMVYTASGSSILECIHLSMRSVGRGFLLPGPHGKYIPNIKMYTPEPEDLVFMSQRIKDFVWASSTDLTVPYSRFMHSKDGVWHLQDVFKVKLSPTGARDPDQLWNVFCY